MNENDAKRSITVLMPVYNQARFIARAIESVLLQTFSDWELVIINDGSTDDLQNVIAPYLADHRLRYFENEENTGLGAALNIGLAKAQHNLIAYLPADDVFYKEHLESLLDKLNENPDTVLAFSGIRHHYNRTANGKLEGFWLQLVQCLHHKTEDRWTERQELVTDDLDRMFWNKLAAKGAFIGTENVSCEWVDHPQQRYKIIQEPIGGINPYKLYYNVKHPLRFHTTMGNFIDEANYYQPFQEKRADASFTGLKIVLVGELAYNAERIVALEQQGHKLYGLWMRDPYWYNTVGPLPFGNVQDIPYENWQQTLAEIKPDVIYALLNWQAVPIAHEVLMANTGVPFVWNFKEGPFICLEKGTWPQLMDLYTKSDGQIYTSPEMRDWFLQFLPKESVETALVLDGDLPKKEWFKEELSPRLSEQDGELHTVVPGRPIGLHPHTVVELAEYKIHVHFYGDFTHGQWKEWIIKTQKMAPGFLHIHPNVTQHNWVKEFSQYDAGWLHFFKSENNGELMRANWDDLNYPARMATLATAGLPMLQRNNAGHLVATQSIIQNLGLGLFFDTAEELSKQLRNKELMQQLRQNVWQKRLLFSFDAHVDELISFLKKVIANKKLDVIDETASAIFHT